LFGRAGRQGDPETFEAVVSLEDEMFNGLRSRHAGIKAAWRPPSSASMNSIALSVTCPTPRSREVGAIDQLPTHHRQAAAGQEFADLQFDGTPVNRTLVNDLAGGGFIAQQRNAVLVGGTGTGKTI
jgi:hypothetical protein